MLIAHTQHCAVKSDWRMAFDNGDWALVPTVEILQEILYFEDSSFNTVCSEGLLLVSCSLEISALSWI